jgi:hypothetical protein
MLFLALSSIESIVRTHFFDKHDTSFLAFHCERQHLSRVCCVQELGGGAPAELMGELVAAKRSMGAGPKVGRDLSDDCKVRHLSGW